MVSSCVERGALRVACMFACVVLQVSVENRFVRARVVIRRRSSCLCPDLISREGVEIAVTLTLAK